MIQPAPGFRPFKRSFVTRLLRGLVQPLTLVSIGLCSLVAFLESPSTVFNVLVVGGIWLYVGLCIAARDTEWAQRNREKGIQRELEWVMQRHRPLRGNYAELALLLFGLMTAGLLVTWQVTAHNAARINALPTCAAGQTSGCIATEHGTLLERRMDGETPTIDVLIGLDVRSIGLNDHGGEGFGSHFPIGEQVTVRYHGSTPLTVTEPDGHRQQTDEDGAGDSAFFKFISIFFAAVTPLVVLSYWRFQSKSDAKLRALIEEHVRAPAGS